jgi:hypothetical protein
VRSDLCSHVKATKVELDWRKAWAGSQAGGHSSLNGPNWVPNIGIGSSEWNSGNLRKEVFRRLVRRSRHLV